MRADYHGLQPKAALLEPHWRQERSAPSTRSDHETGVASGSRDLNSAAHMAEMRETKSDSESAATTWESDSSDLKDHGEPLPKKMPKQPNQLAHDLPSNLLPPSPPPGFVAPPDVDTIAMDTVAATTIPATRPPRRCVASGCLCPRESENCEFCVLHCEFVEAGACRVHWDIERRCKFPHSWCSHQYPERCVVQCCGRHCQLRRGSEYCARHQDPDQQRARSTNTSSGVRALARWRARQHEAGGY